MKLCECGCGMPAPIAKKTYKAIGVIKGQPRRFRRGHAVIARNNSTRGWIRGIARKKARCVEDRFWDKVNVGASSECWTWRGSFTTTGYGQFSFGGRMRKAHRVAWQLTRGPVPSGLFVCHSCDNPECVNPSHLFVGTAADNAHDMQLKGRKRAPSGERHHWARLSALDVYEIRRLARAGASSTDIAFMYSIGAGHVRHIVSGRKWKCEAA